MTWVLIIVGIAIGLPLIVILIGLFLPGEFGARVTASIDRPVDAVWQSLSDYRNHPMSARMCRGVEDLSSENGLPAWRENLGSSKVRVKTVESGEPNRLVREMQDEVVPMRVRCEYEIRPAGAGSEVTASCNGVISRGTWHVPIFKFMIHVFGGVRSGQKQFLASLNKS